MGRENSGCGLLAAAAVAGAAAPAGVALGQACGAAGTDVHISNISDVANELVSGGYDALSLGAVFCNSGSTLLHYAGCPTPTHPMVAGNLYRYTTVSGAGRMEQVGLSWVKHVANPLGQSGACSCGQGAAGYLGIGCSDTYNGTFQSGQPGLGPRYLVNAFTGEIPASCPPHPSGGNFGRLEVALADLVVTAGGPGAATRYFGEQQVVAHDDATWTDAAHPVALNWLNNTSNIELTVAGTPANYTFALLGGSAATVKAASAIQRWKQIDPAVTETAVLVPGPPASPAVTEGKYIVCSRATDLGGVLHMWHYEYAVYNMNSDRCGGSFSVPVAPPGAVTVCNIGFHGVVYRGGDGVGGVNYDSAAWAAIRSAASLTWSTQDYASNANANALRWGTMYSFRFDANVEPATGAGVVTVGLWKPGTPGSIAAAGQVPGALSPCARADVDGNGSIEPADVAMFVGTWFASLQDGTLAGDFDADGVVTPADVSGYVNTWFAALSAGC